MLLPKKYDMGTDFRAHVVDMIIKNVVLSTAYE